MDTYVGVVASLCLCLCIAIGLGQYILWRRLLRISEATHYLAAHGWNTASLFAAARITYPPPPPEGWAASTDLLAELYRLAIDRRPGLVVELGSGLSTLFLASALEANGHGRLLSIDDKPEYLEATRTLLARNGLLGRVELRLAPVRMQGFDGVEQPWYDASAFADVAGIDLLLVDGPGVAGCDTVRLPALTQLWERMGAGALCVLDDADRPGERAIAAAWQARFPSAVFRHLPLRKGALLVGKPGAATSPPAAGRAT